MDVTDYAGNTTQDVQPMSHQMSLRESYNKWQTASPEMLRTLFSGDPEEMLHLLRWLFMGSVPKADIFQAAKANGIELKMTDWNEIGPVNWKPAINEVQQTVVQPQTLTLNFSIPQPTSIGNGPTYAVIGNFHIVQEFWFGAPAYILGEVKSRTVIPLPGNLQQQVILGPGSQAEPQLGFGGTVMYSNLFGMPQLITPPPGDNNGNLPPYSNSAWSSGNVLLYNAVGLSPAIAGPSVSQSNTYNSVLVSYDGSVQFQKALNLQSFYSLGRMISCMGFIQLNSSATGVVTTGSATAAQVNSTAVNGMTQAALTAQDPKFAQTNQLSSTYNTGETGGLWFGQTTQVLQELQTIDYYLANGNSSGGKVLSFDELFIPASGVSGTSLGGTIYQAATPVQNTLPGPFNRNGITDVQTGVFYAVRWYSPSWNINLQYAQSPSLEPNTCQVGNFVCNLYPQKVLSTNIVNTYGQATAVRFPAIPQYLLPKFSAKWEYGMGMVNNSDLGYWVHIFGQIASDGSFRFTSSFEGMGKVGSSGADGSGVSGPSGIIPCGMHNTYKNETQVEFPRQIDDNGPTIDTAWTWLGTLAFLLNMPNAAMN